MEFREVLKHRRMVRDYLPDPVDRDVVERIVRSARRAPSAGYSQGQGFVIVTDADRRRAVAEAMDEATYVEGGGKPWISTAPVHVVLTIDEGLYHERYQQPDKLAISGGVEVHWPVPYWFVDAGAAMMLLLLAAVDEGLAAGFAGHPEQAERLRSLLALPDGVVPIGVITIGRPAPSDDVDRTSSVFKRRRRRAEQVVHWETWDAAPLGAGERREV